MREQGQDDVPAGGASGAPRFAWRDAGASDTALLQEMLALNNAAVPAVNALDLPTLERIVTRSAHCRVVHDAVGLAGFVLCLPHGGDYWSDNYRWFSERYAEFLYLDRVVVAERLRGQGLGAALYADLHAVARGRWPCVTLEVNLEPPNPGSVRFHERLGYARVGERHYEGGAVIMYARDL